MAESIRKTIFLGLLLCFSAILMAAKRDTTTVSRVRTWHLTNGLAIADSVSPDTAYINFMNHNPIDKNSIANSYNGNLVSPIESKIFFDRYQETDFLFSHAYVPYILTLADVNYYNTTVPYSHIAYRKGFATYREENSIDFIFTGNANKNTNFGITVDYLNSVGRYDSQAGKRFAGSLFGSYNGKRYSGQGSVVYNSLRNFENGGIANIDQLNSTLQPEDIPVKLSAMSQYSYWGAYYNQRYSLGVERERKVSDDSIAIDFVPVTTFMHTVEFERAAKRYVEKRADTVFYAHTYNPVATNDTAHLTIIRNTLAVTFEEEFNKWLHFGATVWAENEAKRIAFREAENDTLIGNQWKNNTRIGGLLFKNNGKNLRYSFGGDVCLIGPNLGEFNVHGQVKGMFRLGKDTMSLQANAYIRNKEPEDFLQHYVSNHFRWNNNFDKVYRFFVGGTITYPTKYVQPSLKVDFENLTRYIYFDKTGFPQQHDGSIQVLAADMQLDFRLKNFALENHVIYQLSSDDKLPLPTLSLYHNLYYYGCWFKVLSAQLGVDMRYHTAYYAPLLMPATGQFCLQNEVQIGNYPVMSAYANFYLKRVRFFVQYTHFNALFMKQNIKFSMANYPLNPPMFKAGFSWNFFD